MFWPGMGDPTKRKKVIRYLIITAIIGITVAVGSTFIQAALNVDNPLKNCINDLDTPFKISGTLELYVDNQKAEIPARVGFEEDGCQKSLYTLTNDGTIYAEWTEEYPFEIGHFLWMWKFPMRDMQESKSRVFVNGNEAPEFIRALFVDGYQYRIEFTSKAYEISEQVDFLPPEN